MAVESKPSSLTSIVVPPSLDRGPFQVARWNRQVGEVVVANETLVRLESPTGRVEVPAPASGTLTRIDRHAGTSANPGEALGAIEAQTRGTRVMQAAQVEAAAGPASWGDAPTIPPVVATHVVPADPPTMSERAVVMPRPALSRRLQGFGTTIFTEMTRLSNQHEAINLAQGFPDFDGPAFVKDAMIAAIDGGHGQYARMAGLPALTEALAAKYQREHGLAFHPMDEVVVTAGATEAIFCAIQALTDVGDEVVLLEPYYDSYRASVCMAGAVPRIVTLHTPDWSLDLRELRRAFTARTRLLVLNSPHNPTGKVFTREELQAIADLCIEHDVTVVSDEVYEHLVYEGTHLPIAALPGMRERTVTVSSMGKTFSLTGWKIGWAMAPRPLAEAMRAAHQFVTFAVSTPAQHGAVAAVNAPAIYFQDLRDDYRVRRDLLVQGLRAAGFTLRPPQGTYFVCAEIGPLGYNDDVAFCRYLIEKIGVAAIPPSAFYDRSSEGSTYVRFAFCKKEETLKAAVERLRRLRGVQ